MVDMISEDGAKIPKPPVNEKMTARSDWMLARPRL